MKEHPYKNYEKSKFWPIIEKALQELTKNNDIEEKTARSYIVGYLVKCIEDN
jgi:hypothetical protein